MAQTSVDVAEDALGALILAATPTLDGKAVPVSVGYPAGGVQDRHIYTSGTIDDWRQEPETSSIDGDSPVVERFTLTVVCNVIATGDTWTIVRDLIHTLLGVIRGAVASNHTLSGTVSGAHVANLRRHEGAEGTTRQAVLEIDVACWTQLHPS